MGLFSRFKGGSKDRGAATVAEAASVSLLAGGAGVGRLVPLNHMPSAAQRDPMTDQEIEDLVLELNKIQVPLLPSICAACMGVDAQRWQQRYDHSSATTTRRRPLSLASSSSRVAS